MVIVPPCPCGYSSLRCPGGRGWLWCWQPWQRLTALSLGRQCGEAALSSQPVEATQDNPRNANRGSVNSVHDLALSEGTVCRRPVRGQPGRASCPAPNASPRDEVPPAPLHHNMSAGGSEVTAAGSSVSFESARRSRRRRLLPAIRVDMAAFAMELPPAGELGPRASPSLTPCFGFAGRRFRRLRCPAGGARRASRRCLRSCEGSGAEADPLL